jgi:chromosomal replication initiation ATPase DnaA
VALRSTVDRAVRELVAQLDRLSDDVASTRRETQPAAGADTVVLPPNLGLSAALAAAKHATQVASDVELEEIAGAAGTTLAELRGPSTRRALVEIRRIAARYLRERGCSLPEIGAALNRDHTSILHLLRTPSRAAGRAA